ncbi:MAG: hypothetical protein HY547_05085 [Elusimicrobia bacterium]|nr:hypothetical protein [Elusimicrobiota bacterium]
MPVEIQTVVLCREIENIQGGLCDPKQASVYEIFPMDGGYPFGGSLGLYLFLRKDSRDAEVPFEISLRIMDADGRSLEAPGRKIISGTFPAGYRFWGNAGKISFVIPHPEDYSLFLKVMPNGQEYRYDFEAVESLVASGGGRSGH